MSRVVRRALATTAAAVAAALVLAGCTGLPTNGYVQPGAQVGTADSAPRWLFSPDGPTEDARPEDIVLGFLAAAESPVDDWGTAREFLLDSEAEDWDPSASVTIDSLNDRAIGEFASSGAESGSGTIDVTLTPTGVVNGQGEYGAAAGTPVTLGFELARDEDGQWRIAEAPPGIVVQSGNFPLIFEPRELFFWDPSWTFLVPDVRWHPSTSDPVATISRALVDGEPASWLTGAAVSAFGDGVEVRGTPSSDEGTAEITLSSDALGVDVERQGRMLAQLQASLASSGITEVRLTAAGEQITAGPPELPSTLPDARPVVLTDDDFGHLAGGSLEEIDGLTDAMRERFTPEASPDDHAVDISLARDFSSAVVRSVEGTLWRVEDDATFHALAFGDDLVAPAMDPFGFAWSTAQIRPGSMRVWAPGATGGIELPGLQNVQRVSDIAISRDGARIAIAAQSGGDDVLLAAGIAREDDGTPTGLTDVRTLATLESGARSIAWVSDTVIAAAVVADGRTSILEQTVGGLADRITLSLDVTSLTYGNAQSAERLLTSDGVLYVRRATSWQQVGEGVEVLATQLGAVPSD